ncbi:FAD-binding protein [Yersinia pestis]|uniref:FAD-binding protein n=1 Tax=Yersinia pestis TaxID=632 RepID=UPI0021F26F41|nr:BBE domain-containing protein [Yersinia pestis]MCV6873043.1 FAD-binding protein [Yersinia pestis subsp. pestis]
MKIIDKNVSTYETLQKGFNLRWPPNVEQGAETIYICTTPDEVFAATNTALAAGNRITVRSGGHCYEGFVSNKLSTERLSIIDLGEMSGLDYDEDKTITSLWDANKNTYRFKSLTGNQNWNGYVSLYKRSGRTIPGGSCYSVGVGGHISGGGYGLLSRLHGLTVDWVTGVDILVPVGNAHRLAFRHVRADSVSEVDRELLMACCGAGGGNFGIIIAYYFDDLPKAPQKAYWIPLTYPWSSLKATFPAFLKAYWQWFADNDVNATSTKEGVGNGGLFTLLKLNHIDASDNVVLAIQYTGPNGQVGGANDIPLNDFIEKMNAAAGMTPTIYDDFILPNIPPFKHLYPGRKIGRTVDESASMDWLHVTQMINGSGSNQRGKYKSDYQIKQFSDEMCHALLTHLTTATADKRFNQSLVQIDSYGGAINSRGIGATAVSQRNSLLKAQYQTYWTNEADDQTHLTWIRNIYAAVHNGKPAPPEFEGCYINYPDIDMKYTDSGEEDPNWLNLYYGWDTQLIKRLIALKARIDPNNIFHHELSIPLVTELPKAPVNLHSTGQTTTSISLMWGSSIGALPVASYAIYRDGHEVKLLNGTQTSAEDAGLQPNTEYRYFVAAGDEHGNLSVPSNVLTVNTQGTHPAWVLNGSYAVGDVVSNLGKLWRCIQSHVAYDPLWAPGTNGGITLWAGYTAGR